MYKKIVYITEWNLTQAKIFVSPGGPCPPQISGENFNIKYACRE